MLDAPEGRGDTTGCGRLQAARYVTVDGMVRNLSLIGLALPMALTTAVVAAPGGMSFPAPAASVETYDFIEIAAHVSAPDTSNPFTGAPLTGSFERTDSAARVQWMGFAIHPMGASSASASCHPHRESTLNR